MKINILYFLPFDINCCFRFILYFSILSLYGCYGDDDSDFSKPVEIKSDGKILVVVGGRHLSIPIDQINEQSNLFRYRKRNEIVNLKYISMDLNVEDMSPVTEDQYAVPGWGRKLYLYVAESEKKYFDRRVDKWIESASKPNFNFNSNDIVMYKKRIGNGEGATGDRDIYIHKDGGIYISCINPNNIRIPPSPGCHMISNYDGLEISANFSDKYKTDFVKISKRIYELLSTFKP